MALSEQEILSGLAEIVNEETGLATDAVQPDKSFTDDLDIDSLSMMTIVVNAEEKFGVRIPDDDVKNLKTVGDAVSYDIEQSGNTSATSIPLAMDRMLEEGAAPHGGLALLIGFGAGLTYAAQVVELP